MLDKRILRSRGVPLVLLMALLVIAGIPQRALARVVIGQAVPAPRCNWGLQFYTDFYSLPTIPANSPLGNVLRVEYIRTYTRAQVAREAGLLVSPYGAELYRVLYLSNTPQQTQQVISGMMIVPDGRVPTGGYPVIAYGHGTTGMADSTAPSRTRQGVNDLLSWIAKGYLISATDYTGLGMAEPHPYLVGEVAAQNVLDAARAALRFCDVGHGFPAPIASNKILFVGHSQGGQAVLFAQQAWPRYAPELKVLGTVAFAPAAELRTLVTTMSSNQAALVGPSTMAMYAYSRYYGGPATLESWLKEPYASDLPERAENRDVLSLSLWLGFNPEKVFNAELLADFRAERWDNTQPWTAYLDANTPGNFASDIPVLVIQGQKDLIIPWKVSEKLNHRLCRNGTQSQLSFYPNAGHNVLSAGFDEAAAWVADRLTETPAENGCIMKVWLPFTQR